MSLISTLSNLHIALFPSVSFRVWYTRCVSPTALKNHQVPVLRCSLKTPQSYGPKDNRCCFWNSSSAGKSKKHFVVPWQNLTWIANFNQLHDNIPCMEVCRARFLWPGNSDLPTMTEWFFKTACGSVGVSNSLIVKILSAFRSLFRNDFHYSATDCIIGIKIPFLN